MEDYLSQLVETWPWPGLVGVLLVSILALGKGADLLVESAVALSLNWGMPRAIVGATIVSLGTTTPEAVVSVMAAIQGHPAMALGNAVGSVICDTGLILGIACLIAPLPIDPHIASRQGWIQLACGFLLVALCMPWRNPSVTFTEGGVLPQAGGFLLVGLLIVYLWWSVRLAAGAPKLEEFPTQIERRVGRILTTMLFAIAVVIAASSCLITTAEELAERMHVPPSIVAATLVAFGTSLPELTIVVTATLKGHGELAVGNVIGADILNVLFVAGTAAAVTSAGLRADSHFFQLQFPAMIFVLIVFRVGIATARDGLLKRPFGCILLGTYIVVTVISFLAAGDSGQGH